MSSSAHPVERPPVRVLIVDDSAVARAVIARIVGSRGRFVVAGAVATVATALAFLRQETVDIVLLDIAMPGVDGLTALPDLLAAGGRARIVVVSSSAGKGAANAVRALALGAADTLVKPDAVAMSGDFAAQLLDRLERLGGVGGSAGAVAGAGAGAGGGGGAGATFAGGAAAMPMPGPRDWDMVAIGASTGGIHALGHVLRALPAGFRLPVLVTQHLPATFMPFFAAQLATIANRPCDVATDRMRIRSGRVIVAPGDAHLRCVSIGDGKAAIRLSREPAPSGCLPSADPMFVSSAEVYGSRLLAVVLSGMGRDGADGVQAVHRAGGSVVVQDQATSVVWGMPGAAVAQGCVDAILPPAAIGTLAGSGYRP